MQGRLVDRKINADQDENNTDWEQKNGCKICDQFFNFNICI